MSRYVFTTGTRLAFHGWNQANKRLPYHRKRYNPRPFLRIQRYDNYRLQSVSEEGEWRREWAVFVELRTPLGEERRRITES